MPQIILEIKPNECSVYVLAGQISKYQLIHYWHAFLSSI